MIKFLNELNKKNIPLAGGKGANLGELFQNRIPVPNGFVVTSNAYKEYIKFNKLSDMILKNLVEDLDEETLKEVAGKIRTAILKGEMPEALKEKITQAYQQLGENARVAVRSSATTEDLEDASFAGQQETYLNVFGHEELIEKVKECYASLWGFRAVKYRHEHGYGAEDASLAVVVQLMVESDKAGVLFTVNPANNNRDEVYINGSYGLGEAVVSGFVTPDEYIYDRKGNEKSIYIGSKENAIVYDKKGTKAITISEGEQQKRAMSQEQLKELVEIGLRIEKLYGFPVDIEWAEKDHVIYILQARAITTVTETKTSNSQLEVNVKPLGKMGKKLMTFTLEKCPNPYYPIDFHISTLLSDQKTKLLKEIGLNMEMGYEIDQNGITHIPEGKKSLNRNVFHIVSSYRAYQDIENNLKKGKEAIDFYTKKFSNYQTEKIQNYTLLQCKSTLEQLYLDIGQLAYARFRYFVFPSMLISKKVQKKLNKMSGTISTYDFYSNLDYKTWRINQDLFEISKKFSHNTSLKMDIVKGTSYQKITEQYPEAKKELDAFLKNAGYKSDFNCYCFAGRSWNEEPERLMPLIKSFILSGYQTEEDTNKYSGLLENLKKTCGQSCYESILPMIEFIRNTHIYREESQYLWETAFFYCRSILRRIRILLKKDLEHGDDIYYLFWNELLKCCEEGKIRNEYKELVKERKSHRQEAVAIWDQYMSLVLENKQGGLTGIGASPGMAEGRVCIIKTPAEFNKLKKGEVLVCRYTDPEWTPLFTLASAVISDTGGALSHAAIVAREYGIPAVLGTNTATTELKDGDMVRVNATEGKVIKIG